MATTRSIALINFHTYCSLRIALFQHRFATRNLLVIIEFTYTIYECINE